jgi:hypothetical protein
VSRRVGEVTSQVTTAASIAAVDAALVLALQGDAAAAHWVAAQAVNVNRCGWRAVNAP